MIGEKVMHFQDKQVDLDDLLSKTEDYLKSEKFQVQRSLPSEHGTVLQAQKGGFLAAVVTADRALTISVSGSPDDCLVRIGIGKWIQHLVTAGIETLVISELFLPIDVATTGWNFEVEHKLAEQIQSFVEGPQAAAPSAPQSEP